MHAAEHKLQDEVRDGVVVIIFSRVRYGWAMMLSFTFPRNSFGLPSHPEFLNVRHFPHPQMHAIRFEESFQDVTLQRAADVTAPKSASNRSCCAANGQASILHLVLLAPFHFSKQLGLACTASKY
jgi:hypothetical protein